MTAAFGAFHSPDKMNVLSDFIPYTGPPALKPSSRRRTRKDASSIADGWTDIDKFLEVKRGPSTKAGHEEILTPTMRRAKPMGFLDSGVPTRSPKQCLALETLS